MAETTVTIPFKGVEGDVDLNLNLEEIHEMLARCCPSTPVVSDLLVKSPVCGGEVDAEWLVEATAIFGSGIYFSARKGIRGSLKGTGFFKRISDMGRP